MRNPSFETFITNYVKQLSLNKTLNLKKLANELEDNPRLKEVVYLYSYTMNKSDYLYRFLPISEQDSFQQFQNLFQSSYQIENFLISKHTESCSFDDPFYPYMKIFKSYLSARDKISQENKTKQHMRTQMLEMKNKLGISDYRMCTVVNANHGNLHAFLYQKMDNRLSYDTCSKLYRYLIAQVQS